MDLCHDHITQLLRELLESSLAKPVIQDDPFDLSAILELVPLLSIVVVPVVFVLGQATPDEIGLIEYVREGLVHVFQRFSDLHLVILFGLPLPIILMLLKHFHPPLAPNGLTSLLLLPLAPLQLRSIILLTRMLHSHLIPPLEPLRLIHLPILLPVLPKLIASLPLSRLQIRVHKYLWIGFAVGELFLGLAGAGVLGPPSGALLEGALIARPLMLRTLFPKLLAVLPSVKLGQKLAHYIDAERPFLEWFREVNVRLPIHFLRCLHLWLIHTILVLL